MTLWVLRYLWSVVGGALTGYLLWRAAKRVPRMWLLIAVYITVVIALG